MPTYSPLWCPNVTGTFPNREFEDGKLVPMRIDMVCSICGDTWRHTCETGAVHQWIQQFALQHAHRDPFKSGPQGAKR